MIDGAAGALGEAWSNARFEASRTRIDQQLAGGQLRQAMAGAQQLLKQAEAAGDQAYDGADHDLARAFYNLGRVWSEAGSAQRALPLLQEASRRFEAIAKTPQNKGAKLMALTCLGMQGDCLLDMGRYNEAAAAHQESIRQAGQLGYMRGVAVGKGQLGNVRIEQQRYSDALEAYKEAREIFERLNEPTSASVALHQIGIVQMKTGEPEAAEESLNQSLQISQRINNERSQAKTLNVLGLLYDRCWEKYEDAARLYSRASEISRDLGDLGGEGQCLNNLADVLRKLHRLEEARAAIKRAIDCKEPFGHRFEPWNSFSHLADIETEAGNPSAAAEARLQARQAYLAYRRDHGENQKDSGQVATAVRRDLTAGMPAVAGSLLQQLAADPDWAKSLPFLTALQAITDGSRDCALAEDPALDCDQAAEVLLLIEALEGSGGA